METARVKDARKVAVNMFIQQSLNENGLPFLASPDNEAYMKAKALKRLSEEVRKGWDSAACDGWVSEDEMYQMLQRDE